MDKSKLEENIFKIVEQDPNQAFLQECSRLRQVHDEVEDLMEQIDNSNVRFYTCSSFY